MTDAMRCMQEAIERLRSWAQNQEMIDASYTEHGRDCQRVADDVERLQEELGAFQRRFVAVGEVLKARTRESEIEELRAERAELAERITDMLMPEIERLREGERAADAEIERLRALYIETAARHEGELIRRDEKIRRLRIANGQWERACNGYKEVIAEQDKIINNREDK